jgi:hypothetical protein
MLFIGNAAMTQNNQGNGTQNVRVTNTPLPVTVGNGAALATANAQAFRGTPVAIDINTTATPLYTVPASHQLVIEYVSILCQTVTSITMQTTTNMSLHTYTFFGTSDHLVKIYADQGTNVAFSFATLNGGCGGGTILGTLSGELFTL